MDEMMNQELFFSYVEKPQCFNVIDCQSNNQIHENDAHRQQENCKDQFGQPEGIIIAENRGDKVKLSKKHCQYLQKTVIDVPEKPNDCALFKLMGD